jgi:hypothetical protein
MKTLIVLFSVATCACPARRVEVVDAPAQQNVWRIVDAACKPTANGQVECDGAALGDGLRAVAILEHSRDECRDALAECKDRRAIECGVAAGRLAECEEEASSLIRSPWLWGGASFVLGIASGIAISQ